MLIETLTQYPITYSIGIFCFGLIFGSFINVVAHRLPKILETVWTQQCCEFLKEKYPNSECCPQSISALGNQSTYNLCLPTSHCPQCQQSIAWHDNIPLLGFILLRGKCRSCKKKIPWSYPIVELFAGLYLSFAAFMFGPSLIFLGAGIFGLTLLTLTIIDFRHHLLPDNITLPLLWLGLIFNIFGTFTTLQSAVIGAITGYLILWTVYQIFKIITKKEGMGFGDFKLLAAIGAWLGWNQLPFVIFSSSVLGCITGIILIIRGQHKDTPFAFGPYLALSAILALFWGHDIFQYYLTFWY